jgi:hypothetical protein
MLRPGDSTAASRTELNPRAVSVSPVIAVTAIGTSDSVSSRLRAVTTMIPSSSASAAADVAAPSCAKAGAAPNVAASTSVETAANRNFVIRHPQKRRSRPPVGTYMTAFKPI